MIGIDSDEKRDESPGNGIYGRVHVITGNGKGKTTSGMGMVLRALGNGFSVFVMQFMKDGSSGEIEMLKVMAEANPDRMAGGQPNSGRELHIHSCGNPGFLTKGSPGRENMEKAREGLAIVRAELERAGQSGKNWLFLLDEGMMALDFGLLEESDIVELMEDLPGNVELVLTGRNAPSEISRRADYVSEILHIKHAFDAGVQARKGIEF